MTEPVLEPEGSESEPEQPSAYDLMEEPPAAPEMTDADWQALGFEKPEES